MCYGIAVDAWRIRITDGIAEITHNSETRLTIPVLTMAKLFREGMAQHRRESERPEELARQWEALCGEPQGAQVDAAVDAEEAVKTQCKMRDITLSGLRDFDWSLVPGVEDHW